MSSQLTKFKEEQVLIISPGSQTTMAQLGCAELTPPAYRIPTRMFHDEETENWRPYRTWKRLKETSIGVTAPSKDDYEYVEDPDSDEGATYPIKGGYIINMDAFLAYLEHVHALLATTYHNTPVVLVCSPQWTRPECETIALYLFEKTRTPALCMINSALATQYGLRWPHMTVVDIGFEKVDVTCIYDSRIVSHRDVGTGGVPGAEYSISGGEAFTRHLQKLLQSKNFTYDMSEKLKKSALCEVLPYAPDAPQLMDLPEDTAAAPPAVVPSALAPASGEAAIDDDLPEDDLPVAGEDGVLDVAQIVTSGQTKEFLAKKEKEKERTAGGRFGRRNKDKEAEVAKPVRLPNAKRARVFFYYDEVVDQDSAMLMSEANRRYYQAAAGGAYDKSHDEDADGSDEGSEDEGSEDEGSEDDGSEMDEDDEDGDEDDEDDEEDEDEDDEADTDKADTAAKLADEKVDEKVEEKPAGEKAGEKPVDEKPADEKMTEDKPTDKPADKPAETKPVETKPAEEKPKEAAAAVTETEKPKTEEMPAPAADAPKAPETADAPKPVVEAPAAAETAAPAPAPAPAPATEVEKPAASEEKPALASEDATMEDAPAAKEEPRAEAPAAAPATSTALVPASTEVAEVGAPTAADLESRQYTHVRRELEIGLERFTFAQRSEIDRIVTAIYQAVQGIDDAYMRAPCWENLVFVGNGCRLRGLRDNIMQTLTARHLVSPSAANPFSSLPSSMGTPTGMQTPTGSFGVPGGGVNPMLQAATANALEQQGGYHVHHAQTPTAIKLATLPTYLNEWTKNGFEEAVFLGAQVAGRLAFCVHNLNQSDQEAQRQMSLTRIDYNELGPKGIRTHSML